MTPDVRVSERVEWRNVYSDGSTGVSFPQRWVLDLQKPIGTRIAVERITITERVERFPVPEEGGR